MIYRGVGNGKYGPMAAKSAGILMYKQDKGTPLVLLVHPGGPYWRGKDDGAWSIPKGLLGEGEDAQAAARREFAEELGADAIGPLQALGTIRQSSGKLVEAFALEGEYAVEMLISNSFELEWPPGSGRMESFPEVDRAGWFSLPEARRKILASQQPLLDRFEAMLHARIARS